jgi:valyl-tRNA synthetase
MPAISAVLVHPDDERYTSLVGQKATTPFGDMVTIIADEKVKMDK